MSSRITTCKHNKPHENDETDSLDKLTLLMVAELIVLITWWSVEMRRLEAKHGERILTQVSKPILSLNEHLVGSEKYKDIVEPIPNFTEDEVCKGV